MAGKNFPVDGELYRTIDRRMIEIKRQLNQDGGSPIDPERVAVDLQKIIESAVQDNPWPFELVTDFGLIVVPDNYNHATQLASFRSKYPELFGNRSQNMVDSRFALVSHVLRPGEKFWVLGFKNLKAYLSPTTNEQRLAFIKSQEGFLVGAQGLTLVWEQRSQLFLPRQHYASLDVKKALPRFLGHGSKSRAGHGTIVPMLNLLEKGQTEFVPITFNCNQYSYFLVFYRRQPSLDK
ncbi:MAG: hypothetical protein WC310_02060 [Patescibacteria group bacterium]|jgi:hypothetical protein